ncbi:MAG: NADH-quinone oxidoreductase subunit J, partial [Parachlamydiaceae bacterium]|nr:NADH-quinone oxidoreductase subunit J [Parachlamydiaceae bacterium]
MEILLKNPVQLLLGILLILASLGVILFRKPVHACLSFLLSLFLLALIYLELSAEFIAIMQILVYAGAILVIFMYVIILFQDAYLRIEETPSKSNQWWLIISSIFFLALLIFLGR